MIQLGVLPEEQQAAWQALFELHAVFPNHWVLVGGQNVYLHAIERGAPIVRPTTDADTGLDLRGSAIIDVLIPSGTGERSYSRPGVTGSTTIEAVAIQTAIDRVETVEVSADGSQGNINRANIIGALIGKGAAMRIFHDPRKERHLYDAMTILSVIAVRERPSPSGATTPSRWNMERNRPKRAAGLKNWNGFVEYQSLNLRSVRYRTSCGTSFARIVSIRLLDPKNTRCHVKSLKIQHRKFRADRHKFPMDSKVSCSCGRGA